MTAALTCAAVVAFAEARPPSARRAQAKAKVGEFLITNYAVADVLSSKDRALDADVIAAAGQKVQATSPQYDMSAARIRMRARRPAAAGAVRAESATATGGVRIVVRSPEENRVSVLTADRAEYAAGPAKSAPYGGTITLTGNVVSNMRDMATGETIETSSNERGLIDLIDRNTTRIRLFGAAGGGSVRGVINEPAAKPAAPKGP